MPPETTHATKTRPAEGERIKSHTNTPIAKVIEIIGNSEESFEDAIRRAVSTAGETLDHITGIEVSKMGAKVENGEIREFRVDLKLAFGIERNR